MDILINENNLAFAEGDLVVIDGITEVKQHIITALKTMSGEWILDNSKGLDYTTGFRNQEFFENDIKKQILGVNGVEAVENFGINFNKSEMSIAVSSDIRTVYGNFLLEEIIKI